MNRNNVMKVVQKRFLRSSLRRSFRVILFLLLDLIILWTFHIYLIIKSFLISLYTDYDFYNNIVHSYGISNFTYLFKDPKFGKSLINTFLFVAGVVPISIIISLAIALLINRDRKSTRLNSSHLAISYA